MKIGTILIAHADERGEIRDIIPLGSDTAQAVAYVTCAAGSSRGNHYHVSSTARVYVIRGRFLVTTRAGAGAPIECEMAHAGQLITFAPGERHRLEALEDSAFLMLRSGFGPGASGLSLADDIVREEP